jgi:hypothetical protein
MSCGCGSEKKPGVGPFATGRTLVEFVMNAHGGSVAGSALPGGGFDTTCQECDKIFVMDTFVKSCPECGGVHAISPPRANDPQAVQFAGADFRISA